MTLGAAAFLLLRFRLPLLWAPTAEVLALAALLLPERAAPRYLIIVFLANLVFFTGSMITGQPAVEAMIGALSETDRDPGLDLEKVIEVGQELEQIAPRYRDFLNDTKMAVIETGVLQHQVPGGMLTNMESQLREQGAADKLDAVLEDLPERGRLPDDEDMRVALVGRPNVGKSSLVNRLLGEDRVVVSEVPGTTRDAVDTRLERDGDGLVVHELKRAFRDGTTEFLFEPLDFLARVAARWPRPETGHSRAHVGWQQWVDL